MNKTIDADKTIRVKQRYNRRTRKYTTTYVVRNENLIVAELNSSQKEELNHYVLCGYVFVNTRKLIISTSTGQRMLKDVELFWSRNLMKWVSCPQ